MDPTTFQPAIGEPAAIDASGQVGLIVGYTVTMNSEPQWLLRYKNAAGDAVEQWWAQSALVAPPILAASAT